MANITQSPAEFNLVAGPNVWTLDNLGAADRYLLQVEIAGTAVATFKQTANPAGVAHFDLSQILQSWLSNAFTETTQKASTTAGAAVRYRVRWGTQTGATISWDGYSDYKVVINGYKEFSDLDWPAYSQYIAQMDAETACAGPGESPYSTCTLASVDFMSTYPGERTYSDLGTIPEKPVYADEWHTISWANFHTESWLSSRLDVNNKSPWAVQIEFYNASGTLYETKGYFLTGPNGMPVRTSCTSADWTMTDESLIGTLGAGPKNLELAGLWPATAPAWYRITLWTKGCAIPTDCDDIVDIQDTSACLWAAQSFKMVDDCTKFTPIQMSFLNEFGVRDYWTFRKRNTYTDNIRRNNYQRDVGTWSGSTYTIQTYERGEQTFNTEVSTTMSVTTDWVEDDVAAWLEKLFVSPDAKIYYEGQWLAVTLQNTNYQQKTVARDNKIYNYTLDFQFANNQRIQRG